MFRSLAAVLVLALATATAEESIFDGAPPAPPGYDTHLKAQAAVLTGKVQAMELDDVAVPDTIKATKDIVYASPDGNDLHLDLFVPNAPAEPKPILLFIHGGGWSGGNKDDYLYYNVEFAKLGYVTASMQYRLTPKFTFPDNVLDVKCAIAWLKTNARDFSGDPNRMALIGGSAGGHLSLMGGYISDPEFECADLPEGIDTRVQAIVNLYGVVDCTVPVAQEAHQVKNYIGKPYTEAPELYEAASPIHYLTADDPPTLTFHGTIDELVPIAQADVLHKRLDELGIPNYYDKIEGWPHSMDLAKPINDRCRYISERFLAKYLAEK